MRSLRALVFALLLTGGAHAATAPDPSELENVAAFARLYGVVRWFHPADAAQEIDWNRFAVHGVEQVRGARTPRDLQRELKALFAPLAAGLDVGRGPLPAAADAPAREGTPVRWMHEGFGGQQPYASERLGRPAADKELGYSLQHQTIEVEPLRGKVIRLRGQIAAEAADTNSGAGLFAYVSRQDGTPGYNDSMLDRLVREREWRDYAIEGRIDDDAAQLMIGVSVRGTAKAAFDALALDVMDDDGHWTPIELPAAGFETEGGWAEFSTTDTARWERLGSGATVGAHHAFVLDTDAVAVEGQYAMYAASASRLDEPLFALPAEAHRGRATGVSLGRGLSAQVPLVLSDASAKVTDAQRRGLDELRRTLDALPAATPADADVRLADVVVAWNVFRHFYPYWREAAVDWDARLLPLLQAAAPDADGAAAHARMERLVHEIRDGHGFVLADPGKTTRYWMPVALRRIQGELIVTGSDVDTVHVGDIVRTFDGRPVAPLLAEYAQRASGTDAWREWAGARRLMSSFTQDTVTLGLERDGAITEVTVARKHAEPTYDTRPQPLAELAPGVWYVDLERSSMDTIAPRLDAIAHARAVVFDMRGYPTDAGAGILPHLLDRAENTRWMHIPHYVAPFGDTAGEDPLGWNLEPEAPHIEGRVVFLTDTRAISYAESVMGYVQDHALGAIVGSATAGTNGNVVAFALPSGFEVRFTAMRVTRHDGKTPLHLIGVQPTVPVEPTLAGIRAGRDEVLERALQEIGVEPVHAARNAASGNVALR